MSVWEDCKIDLTEPIYQEVVRRHQMARRKEILAKGVNNINLPA